MVEKAGEYNVMRTLLDGIMGGATSSEAAGLTQRAAAALVFADLRSWQKWEGGERQMHPAFWMLFLLRTGQETLADLRPAKTADSADSADLPA